MEAALTELVDFSIQKDYINMFKTLLEHYEQKVLSSKHELLLKALYCNGIKILEFILSSFNLSLPKYSNIYSHMQLNYQPQIMHMLYQYIGMDYNQFHEALISFIDSGRGNVLFISQFLEFKGNFDSSDVKYTLNFCLRLALQKDNDLVIDLLISQGADPQCLDLRELIATHPYYFRKWCQEGLISKNRIGILELGSLIKEVKI